MGELRVPDRWPFDAQEIYLSDRSKETGGWRTVSLVVALREMLKDDRFRGVATVERAEVFEGAARELTRRGLDAVALVRHGLYREVAGALIAGIAATSLASERYEGFDHESWAEVLRLPNRIPTIAGQSPSEAADAFGHVIAPLFPQIISWISTASLRDMVELRAPETIREISDNEINQFFELHTPYRWMIDYFSKTFYREWTTESLHLTHRWLQGFEGPPCSPELMDDRRIDPGTLAFEIADRAASKDDRGSHKVSLRRVSPARGKEAAALVMGSLAGEMRRHAVGLLRQGRTKEAAALFEFGVKGAPDNAELYNDWGFCLIPVEPHRALKLLIEAQALGYFFKPLNIYNQMCCLVSLGRHQAALSLAANSWDSVRACPPRCGNIWRLDGFSWALEHTKNVCREVADLAVSVATRHGRHDQVKIWSERIVALGAS
ncbi:hypothetical protein ABT340_30450 [Streptosporangium sp. NPDC000239]|uniref:tetratricopeptide repeat protein n=1 Tax=Streptosporangium sp. NPDC000239 TaxID=3154248 RepID=UPI00331A445B